MKYNTDRKNEVIALLSEKGQRALTTEEICEKILSDGKGKSTVYRIVSELVREGAVKKIADSKTRRVTYQYLQKNKCGEHLHLKCKSCDRLIHLNKSTSELIISSLKSSDSFSLDPMEILSGVCQSCARKEK